MGWAKTVADIFSGGIVGSVEKVALEWIETDKEAEEAKALKVKALDPNGKMRRDIMRFIVRAYGAYLIIAGFLILSGSFGLLDENETANAFAMITETFMPITGLFGALSTASFGVNMTNVVQDRKQKKYNMSTGARGE